MTSKLSSELDLSVRDKIQWQNLPIHLKQVSRVDVVVFIISRNCFHVNHQIP